MNQNYYDPNLCYNSNSPSFDQYQPPQYFVTHQPLHIKSMADLLLEEKLSQALKALCEKLNKNIQGKQEEKNVAEEQAAKVSSQYWKPLIYYDDDDNDKESSIPLKDIIFELPLSIAITPYFPITNSLIIEDEHQTKSDEENESSVKDLNLTPSEYEDLSTDLSKDLSDIESECDMPVCDDFTTFSNPLFDSNDDFTSSDDESFFDEDVSEENFKIYSNPLFDEEIISTKIDPHHFNAESDLIESLLNRDTLIVSSPNLSPSPIPVKGSDSLMEEIDIFLAPDDSIPPGIENDDYDSEGDILEELLNNDSVSLPENKSFHFDRYYDPSSPRPPAKPPDYDGIYFDAEPDTRDGNGSGNFGDRTYHPHPRFSASSPSPILPTQPTLSLCPVIDTLFPFSSENEDKVFNTGILASKEEKSPHLLSHRVFKAFQLISDFSESPMMIYGGNIPILDVLSLISLNRGSFDVIVEIDWLSKRKFVIEQLSFMEAKVDEPKVGDISVVRDFVDVFPEDFSGLPPQQQVEFCIGQGVGLEGRGTRVSYDLVIFREKHQCCFLRREAWSSFEVSVGIAEEGEVSSVKDKILATSSETSKVEHAPAEMLRDLDQQMEKRADDGKANVVTDALSRKERVKPRRVRARIGPFSMDMSNDTEAQVRRSKTTDKVVLIKEKLKAARDRQKSYADNRRNPLEFEVGDRVMLKVSPWKGVIRLGKKAYRLRFPEELSRVHDTFHVSTKKCLADASLHVPLDEIRVDKTLRFIEEPIEIMDHEVKRLKRSRISLVKVR
ncbi:hypothetical protein Tco_0175525 [Tanacetum coccineum]